MLWWGGEPVKVNVAFFFQRRYFPNAEAAGIEDVCGPVNDAV